MTAAPTSRSGDQRGDPGHRSGLASLPPTRRELVNLLKKQGTVDADELATRMGLSTSAVRQQLTALQRDGLVTFDEVKHGLGRPRHRYRLTSAGDSLSHAPTPTSPTSSSTMWSTPTQS